MQFETKCMNCQNLFSRTRKTNTLNAVCYNLYQMFYTIIYLFHLFFIIILYLFIYSFIYLLIYLFIYFVERDVPVHILR